jgi:hypothetical protein
MHTDNNPPKELLSVENFLTLFSISRNTFYSQVRLKKLKIKKIGIRTYVTRADANAWMNELQAGGND